MSCFCYYFFVVFLILRLGSGNGNQRFQNCKYKFSKNGTEVPIISKDETAFAPKFTAYFNLCDSLLAKYCGEGVKACIKRNQEDSWFIAGYEIKSGYMVHQSLEKENSLHLSNITSPYCEKIGKKANVIFKFDCSDDTEEKPQITEINECNFEIRLLNSACTPRCTVRLRNHLIDLRPLVKVYNISDNYGSFSIGFCTSNPSCDEQISSCLIKEDNKISLSTTAETIQYDEETNVIKFHGKFKGARKSLDNIMEIQIKCDWTQREPKLHFLKMPKQGKTYHFEMLTDKACPKLDPIKEVRNGLLRFNLEALYERNNYWRISLDGKEEIVLNLSGAINFPTENVCSRSFSQVCFQNGSEFHNFGSIQTPLQINDDILSMSFTNGEPCDIGKYPTQQYHTTIEFYCDSSETGPQLDSKDNCGTLLKWKTPHACPKNDKSACPKVRHSYQNCFIQDKERFFNITSLFRKNSKYVVQDGSNNEYFLNICGPVFDDDVTCNNNNSIFLRNKSEIDIRKSLVSLGKMRDFYVKDDELVVEMISGGYCEPHDYQSTIYLKCSDKNGEPQLKSKSKCKFEFIWDTSAACPVGGKTGHESNCVFQDHSTSEMIDFKKLKTEHYLKVSSLGTMYIFDLCNSYKGECNINDNCIHVPPKKDFHLDGTQKYVEFLFNKACKLPSDFNRTLMEVVCDPIENNDHYEFEPVSENSHVSDCVFRFKLHTNLACTKQIPNIYRYHALDDTHKQVANTVIKNCSVHNPTTQYSFSLNNLKLNFSIDECPTQRFNYSEKTTELVYKTDNPCLNGKGESHRFQYYVLLKCSDKNTRSIQKNLCNETYIFEQSDYCKLIEDNSTQDSMHWAVKTGIGLGVFMLVVILCVGGMLFMRKHRTRYNGVLYFRQYCKNGDL